MRSFSSGIVTVLVITACATAKLPGPPPPLARGSDVEGLVTRAGLALSQGEWEGARSLYRKLIASAPRNRHVCRWQLTTIHLASAVSHDARVTAIEDLVRLWTRLRDQKVLPVIDAKECHDLVAELTVDLALTYHWKSQPGLLPFADRLYEAYLGAFPDGLDVTNVRVRYADLLWTRAEGERSELERTRLLESAAVKFTAVVRTASADRRMRMESAWRAVLAWETAIADDLRASIPTSTGAPRPRPIPEREQKLLAAYGDYSSLQKDPDDEELITMKLRAGNIYRRHDHLDEAIARFKEIVDRHLDHESAGPAATALHDAYRRTQRIDELRALEGRMEVRDILRGRHRDPPRPSR